MMPSSSSRGDMHRWHILRALVGEGGGLPIMGLSWSQQFTCNQSTEKLSGFRKVAGPVSESLSDPGPYYGGPSLKSLPSSLADSWCSLFFIT